MPLTSPRHRFALLVAVVVVLAAVAPPLATVSDDAGSPVGATVTEAGPAGTATFAVDEITEHRGDVVRIPVHLSGAGKATVRVAGEGYEATVVLDDEDGDDRIALRLNTARLGHGTPKDGIEVAGIDDVRVVEETQVGGMPPAGEYDLGVAGGPVPNFSYPNDGATLHLEARPAPETSFAVAPAGTDLDSLDAIERAREDGRLTNLSTVANGEVLVMRVHAPGLAGTLANASSASAGLRAMFEDGRIRLRAEQTRESTSPEMAPIALEPAPGALSSVVADPGSDTYYLVFDTGAFPSTVVAPDGDGDRLEEVYVPVGLRTNLTIDGHGSVENVFALAGPDASLDHREDGDFVYRSPGDEVRVAGNATLPPGSTLTVTVAVPEGRNLTRTVRVRRHPATTREGADAPPGRFSATFDLSDVPEGVTVDATVRRGDRRLDRTEVRLDDQDASLRFADQETRAKAAGVVSLTNVSLSRPGFVVIHRGTVDGPVVHRSQALSAGTYPRVTVRGLGIEDTGTVRLVAVVYRDVDGDGAFDPDADRPFRVRGQPVAEAASVQIRPLSTSTTSTTSTTTTTTTTSTTTTTTTSTTDDGTTATSPGTDPAPVPGFGAGVALVAVLLGVAALARRR